MHMYLSCSNQVTVSSGVAKPKPHTGTGPGISSPLALASKIDYPVINLYSLQLGVATVGHWPYLQPLWSHHQYFNLSHELITKKL